MLVMIWLDVLRSTVFVGSTNAAEFLNDSTGSSRFHVIEVGQIDLGGLSGIREQLWAQGATLYKQSVSHWLNADDTAASEAINVRYQVEAK